MKIHPIVLLHKTSAIVFAVLSPLGIWGLGALALIDSGFFPIPVSMDGVLIGYVTANHGKFFLYCLMAAFASALGSMIPFYVGRAGGEIFLLKRIDRERYEKMRDRFERQQFMAIMIPAALPPPTPLKVFEIAAGVLEMKPFLFATAIFCGKFVQFMVCALITIFYGPAIMHALVRQMHSHPVFTLTGGSVLIVALASVALRKLFDSRRGTRFPAEDIAVREDVTT